MDYGFPAECLHILFFIIQGILFYLTLTLFLHCFYDDAIRLKKPGRRSVFKLLLLPVLYIPVSWIMAFFIGFTDGNVARNIRIELEASANDWFTSESFTIYILSLLMIPGIRQKGFRKTVRRFFTALLFLVTIAAAVHLSAEMLRYCITATGLYRVTDMEYGSWCIIMQQLIISLLLGTMLLMLIVIPVLLIRNRISVSYQERSAYQERFLEAELQASRQYKAAQEDTRAFRHDVQNNLTVVSMLLQDGKTEKAKQYVNEMCAEINALSPKIVSGDEMVDALISAKLAEISERGITFRMDGVIDGGLNWKPLDICTVFANLLDNAIEAAGKTENGFIDLEFKKSEHHRLIRASNSCAEEADCDALMLSGSHFTSKQDKALHGYGIGNLRRTVEKNGGMMKNSCEEHVFTMEMILPK